jgi:hypothetical protein
MQTMSQAIQSSKLGRRALASGQKAEPEPAPSEIPMKCPHCGAPAEDRVFEFGTFKRIPDSCCNARAFEVARQMLENSFSHHNSPDDRKRLSGEANEFIKMHLTLEQRVELRGMIPALEQRLKNSQANRKSQFFYSQAVTPKEK